SATVHLKNGVKYYVTVRASNGDGNTALSVTAISDGVTVKTSLTLTAPKPTKPTGAITTDKPTFTWTAVANVDHYYVLVNAVINGSEVKNTPALKNSKAMGTSWTPSTTLTRNRSYVWYIAAVSDDGTTVWSTGKTFFITA